MYFGLALDLSDVDLLNVDLLDQRYTHLDLFVSKTSCRRLQDISTRRLQDMSSRRLQDMSSSRLQDVLEDEKLLRWRHVEDVFKTSWKPTNVCWEVFVYYFICLFFFERTMSIYL